MTTNIKKSMLSIVAVVSIGLGLTAQAQLDSIYLDPIEVTPQMPSSYSLQNNGNWGIPFLNIDDYFDTIEEKAKRQVAVFVFDTGGKFSHSALQSASWPEEDATFTGEESPIDGNGHSTHVAGIYAGLNESAFVGVGAPLVRAGKLKVIAYKVLNNEGRGANTGIYQAMRKANERSEELIKEGWFVIYNFSLGGSGTNAVFNSFMNIAEEMGVLVVGASGNSNREQIITPANGPDVFAVGAMNSDGEKAYFSSYGDGLWLVAPGQSIFSTYPPNTYRELSGTSMATPFQGAVCAIVASLKPEWSNREVAKFLEENITDIPPPGKDKFTGRGYNDAKVWFPALKLDDKPEEPEGPPRKKRDVELVIDLVLPVKWKPLVDNQFQYAQCQITVSVKNTDIYAGKLYDEIRSSANRFYNDHSFFLAKGSDFIDAGYWSGVFFRRWMSEERDLKVEVERMVVDDGHGRKAVAPTKSAITRTWIQLFNPEIGFTKN